MPKVGLAIDTTFDDTSVALVRGRQELLVEATLSQIESHRQFGGVVPERASRKHLEVIHHLIRHNLDKAEISFSDLDWIAVSHKPGLMGSILVGLAVAKTLAFALDLPLIGINHIEAHPYGCLLDGGDFEFPILHLVVAGGHTVLILQTRHLEWTIVGRSLDDAAGECADKVARLFGLPMPGGKSIDMIAYDCEPGDYSFPRPLMNKDSFDFSFSGLKTAMKIFHDTNRAGSYDRDSVLSAFFESICDVLVHKTLRAAAHFNVDTVTLSGGLAASRQLRRRFESATQKAGLGFICPQPRFCTDNAAMVACLASFYDAAGLHSTLDLEALPNLSE
jgi:N6-L-threonylcarbamoyladenine synthase